MYIRLRLEICHIKLYKSGTMIRTFDQVLKKIEIENRTLANTTRFVRVDLRKITILISKSVHLRTSTRNVDRRPSFHVRSPFGFNLIFPQNLRWIIIMILPIYAVIILTTEQADVNFSPP